MPTNLKETMGKIDSLIFEADFIKKQIYSYKSYTTPDHQGELKKIEDEDQEYKTRSVDETTTEMAAVVQEAEHVSASAQVLVGKSEQVNKFYDADTIPGVAQEKLEQAAQMYNELKTLIKSIDEYDEKAKNICGRVHVLDTDAKRHAEKLLHDVEISKSKTYSLVAQSLANLVKNMYSSAIAAADNATAIHGKVTIDIIDRNSASSLDAAAQQQTTNVNSVESFEKQKTEFDEAIKCMETLKENGTVFSTTLKEYMVTVNIMKLTYKDSTSASSEINTLLQTATEKNNQAVAEEKKFNSLRDEKLIPLSTKMSFLENYLKSVEKEFVEVETKIKDVNVKINELNAAIIEGNERFKYYDAATGSNYGTDEAMEAADKAYEKVTTLHADITSEISEVEGIFTRVTTNPDYPKFNFVNVKAQTQKEKLDQLIEGVKKSVDELTTKRIQSFKIDKIDLIINNNQKVTENMKKVTDNIRKIHILKKQIDDKKSEIEEKIYDIDFSKVKIGDDGKSEPQNGNELLAEMNASMQTAEEALRGMEELHSKSKRLQTLQKMLMFCFLKLIVHIKL